jgi:hypothetical protein
VETATRPMDPVLDTVDPGKHSDCTVTPLLFTELRR